jgi:hypothetical protein
MQTVTPLPDRLALFLSGSVSLKYGNHPRPKDDASLPSDACAVELTSWLAGEEWSDHPTCACPVLAAAVRSRNDRMGTDELRTRFLLDVVPALVGSRRDRATEIARAYAIVDWSVRGRVPALLDALGQTEDAALLRALAVIESSDSANAAREVATAIRGRQQKRAATAAGAAAAAAAFAAAAAAFAAADADAAAADAAAAAAYAAAADAAATDADADAAAAAADAAADAAAAVRKRIAAVVEETNRRFAGLIIRLAA